MNFLEQVFGIGKELLWYQMGARAAAIFLITLIYIRFAGSRAFGMRSPFDNVLSILLGAVLSRTIAGASEFFPTIFAAFVIAALHRLFALLSVKSDAFGKLVKGDPVIIAEHGKFIEKNMTRCMVTRKDFDECMREAGIKSIDEVQKAVIERSGKINIVKK